MKRMTSGERRHLHKDAMMNNRQGISLPRKLVLIAAVLVLGAPCKDALGVENEETSVWKPAIKESFDAALFEPSDVIRVVSPTHFPKPTRKIDDRAVPIVEPTFGRHRSGKDAVFAYAEGYKLSYYMMFLETLKETGFSGDVVMAIAERRIVKPDVEDYLKTYALDSETISEHEEDDGEMHVVVYQTPLDCEERDGVKGRFILPSGDTDVFQMCQLDHVYGWRDEEGHVTGTARDPREGRVVATLRYEWYWIWSLQYRPEQWIMLIDARDSFFQTNPFDNLPRQKGSVVNGLLYFFGENTEATRLGKSHKNYLWLRNGYGEEIVQALKEKPTICSGSTMGEQIAIETYLRALVNEHDECRIKMTGSDQGFHNYLYYSSKLNSASTIRRIVVWEQGRGVINNLGALRTKTLAQWGIYNPDTHIVYQWNGTKSAVVHQWDRDKQLYNYMLGKRHRAWESEWQTRKKR
jgi:hypothetical protein